MQKINFFRVKKPLRINQWNTVKRTLKVFSLDLKYESVKFALFGSLF